MLRVLPPPRRRKYLNKPTIFAGERFDSLHEAHHFALLLLRQRAGAIRNLRRQVIVPLVVQGHRVSSVRVDFVYEERVGTRWVLIYEDTKSERTRRTAVWRLKQKLFAVLIGAPIREVLPRS